MSWLKNLLNKNKIANKDKTFNSNTSSNIDASDTKIKGNVNNTHNEIYPNAYYCSEIAKKLSDAHNNYLNAKSKLLSCSKCCDKIKSATSKWNPDYFNVYGGLWTIENPQNIVLRIFDDVENIVCYECKKQISIMKKSIVDYSAYTKAAKLNKI